MPPATTKKSCVGAYCSSDESTDTSSENPTPPPTGTPPNGTPPPDPNEVIRYELPGEFLRVQNGQYNFNRNVAIPNGKLIRQIRVRFNFIPRRWDPNKQNGWHCLFWLQMGRYPNPFRWEGGNLGYLNLKGPGSSGNKAIIESNVNGHAQAGTSYTAQLNEAYTVEFEHNGTTAMANYRIINSSGSAHASGVRTGFTGVTVINGGVFIQFGSQYASEGPEAQTIDWSFSDLTLELW